MPYFLKVTNNNSGTYLQIYYSYYDHEKKQGRNRSFKAIGYVHQLKQQGYPDPIEHFKSVVDQMNLDLKAQKENQQVQEIGEVSIERYLGYFLIKNLNDSLKVQKQFSYIQKPYQVRYDLFEVLSSLIYARVVDPCSKYKSFHDVLPSLFEPINYSQDQLYSALQLMGNEYEKIIEAYNLRLNRLYPFVLSTSYFDCTNFYFEIDQEDELRRKGKCKHNSANPLVGMGLLLDAHQVPISMNLYPGNQSEMGFFRETLLDLKDRYNVSGRSVRVADKGVNSAQNIQHAIENGDGYLFSKSVKSLPETEKQWVYSDNDWVDVRDSKGKLLFSLKECVDDFSYKIDLPNGKKKEITFKEKRVLTYNPSLARKKQKEIMRQIEKAQKLSVSAAKRSEYGDSAKYVVFSAQSTDSTSTPSKGKVKTFLNEKKIDEDMQLAGYNLLVTSEIKQSAKDIYMTYHNLWRIEESFKVMKSQLEARPVYCQTQESIFGHFLICYLSVVLLRVLQVRVFEEKYHTDELLSFMKNFKVVQVSDSKYMNISNRTMFIEDLAAQTSLPLKHLHMNNTKINSILNYRF